MNGTESWIKRNSDLMRGVSKSWLSRAHASNRIAHATGEEVSRTSRSDRRVIWDNRAQTFAACGFVSERCYDAFTVRTAPLDIGAGQAKDQKKKKKESGLPDAGVL